jgi:hypothetical protein
MRVEQRIGRIDRIGQIRPEVAVVNLYVADTIEQDAYQILRQRIGFFEEVVGPLQPILAEMPRLLRRVALGEMERDEALRAMRQLTQRQAQSPLERLEDFTLPEGQPDGDGHSAPVTQAELAAWCINHPAMGMTLTPHVEPNTSEVSVSHSGCFSLTWQYAPAQLAIGPSDEVLVTFSAELADRNPPTAPQQDDTGEYQAGSEGVRLLTWGDPLLEAWLQAVIGSDVA